MSEFEGPTRELAAIVVGKAKEDGRIMGEPAEPDANPILGAVGRAVMESFKSGDERKFVQALKDFVEFARE